MIAIIFPSGYIIPDIIRYESAVRIISDYMFMKPWLPSEINIMFPRISGNMGFDRPDNHGQTRIMVRFGRRVATCRDCQACSLV